jgi:hypothetical protein
MASNDLALRLDPAPLIIRFLASHLSPSRFTPRIASRFNALPLHSSGMLKSSDVAAPSAALPFHPHSCQTARRFPLKGSRPHAGRKSYGVRCQLASRVKTSHTLSSLAAQGITIKPSRFLGKPFSVKQLLMHVTAALTVPLLYHE